MKIIGIICVAIGLSFGILHTINMNAFGVLTAIIALICGFITVFIY